MAIAAQDYRRYLDPAVLARITGLDLRARLMVQGFISGLHRSPAHGFSVEFAEHRKYCQGDDLRFMDWKVFGRTDKHYIKEYEQESNLRLLLAVDCSESMTYKSVESPLSKREYAMSVAAALAYLAVQQSDAVGLAVFDTRLHYTGRPSNHPGRWKTVVTELAQTPSRGRTAFRAVLDELADTLHQRHLIILISDLLGPEEEILSGLKHLRHERHELVVFHVLDRAELTFPFSRPVQFMGLEDMEPLTAEPRVMRQHYLRQLHAFVDRLRGGCHEQQIDYEVFDTSASLGAALSSYLSARAASARRWR